MRQIDSYLSASKRRFIGSFHALKYESICRIWYYFPLFIAFSIMPLMRYKLKISYDGSCYGGWQVQPNAISIQQLIQNALQIALRSPIDLTGSSRTDAGVHALGQIAHFSSADCDPKRLLASLNGLLPKDIRILSIEPVDEAFHARYSATSKTYHYHIDTAPWPSPFTRTYSMHVPFPLNTSLIQKAKDYLIGTHDFSAFACEAHSGNAARNPIRTLTRIAIIQDGSKMRMEFEANGFLYKMVRSLVGTLLDVGSGKTSPEEIPHILNSKDRRRAGPCAPPHGLFLVNICF